MKCPSCGEENKEGSKFCKHCGGSLQTQAAPAQAPVSQPKDSKNTLIICATAIICVIIIAGAFVFLNNGSDGGNDVNVASSAVDDSVNDSADDKTDDSTDDKKTDNAASAKNSVDSMSYSEASTYLSGASSTVISNTFDEADKNGDGVLTGSEITNFKSLADLTERTADTSNTENVEAQDYYGTGDGTTKTRYCTTHGRVAVGSDNLCPYCQQEGLDARTVKGSTEYI